MANCKMKRLTSLFVCKQRVQNGSKLQTMQPILAPRCPSFQALVCLTVTHRVDHRWLDKGAHIVVARLADTAVGAQSVDALGV